MEPWAAIAAKYGVELAGAAIVAWFLGAKVWPWMTGQVEKTQTARERDLDRFSEQIGRVGKEQTDALHALAEEIRRKPGR